MRWLLLAFLCTILSAPAQADDLRPGYLELNEVADGRWGVSWKLPFTPPAPTSLPRPEFPQHCDWQGDPMARSAPAAIIGSGSIACDGPLAGHSIAMPSLTGKADMLARIAPLEGPPQALRLTAAEPRVQIAAAPSRWQVVREYFVIGVEHIIFGWDHLLFVVALCFLLRRGWEVVKAATAFTVAHSITLAGASLGLVGLPGKPVEAIIALSIVFLAVEIARGKKDTLAQRWPWLVAFAFGLIHGFGFAGALSEIGLPQGEIPAALLAFNLGVEAGQVFVIALIIGILALASKLALQLVEPSIRVATYAIGVTGAFWLFERVLA